MKTKIFILIIFNLIILNLQSGVGQMFWNQAASFAGTNSSYISVKNSSTLSFTGTFTLEAWVNPNPNTSTAIILTKGSLMSYALSITQQKLQVWTNSTIRLTSSQVVTANQWTHVAVTFFNGINLHSFNMYINGVLDTGKAYAPSASIPPASNSDSLYIGKAGLAYPFSGMMDEIRIWNRALSPGEISQNMRITLGTNGGRYAGLVMSLPFQHLTSLPILFSGFDFSNNGNGFNLTSRITAVDLSNLPSKTITTNQNIFFLNNGYLAGGDQASVSPVLAVTLQAWILRTGAGEGTIIHKGTANGTTTNYSLYLSNEKLTAKINGIVFDSQDTIPHGDWTHVAFTYFPNGIGSVKGYRFWVNGVLVKSGNLTGADIADGTDSLYIGGSWSSSLTGFVGYIDEVRISKYSKLVSDINDSLYMSMNGLSNSTAAYNFDGYTFPNTNNGPFLYFKGNPMFSDDFPSPLNNGFNINFQKGFYMKTSNHRIPETGLGGVMTDDTINVFLDENITDVNVYIALNHSATSELTIDLIPPGGGRIYLSNLNTTISPSNHITTVFDDQTSTSLSNNTYTSFSSIIKSSGNILNLGNGRSTKGLWTLKIRDFNSSANVGKLYAWGIQFNNKSIKPKVLSCTGLIQGFYNPASNLMTSDTMKCYLRSFPTPYPIIDSSKAYLQSDGTAIFAFTSPAVTNTNTYYIQLKHRNSIETWSKNLLTFPSLLSQLTFDFTTDSTKAFGNNQKRVDNSPVKYAFFSGDPNQDGTVDAADMIKIFNDVNIFASGYISTDVNGDNIADVADLILTFNNANAFVSKITP